MIYIYSKKNICLLISIRSVKTISLVSFYNAGECFKSVLRLQTGHRLLRTNGRCCVLEAAEINFEHYRCRGAPRREANTLLA